MRFNFNKHTARRRRARLKNKIRIRKKVKGTPERPRLCVYRSLKNIYAQVIDDVNGVTIASASSKDEKSNSKEIAKKVGEQVAKQAMAKNVEAVVFDRSGYLYHGKIQSLADGARESGLKF